MLVITRGYPAMPAAILSQHRTFIPGLEKNKNTAKAKAARTWFEHGCKYIKHRNFKSCPDGVHIPNLKSSEKKRKPDL